MEMEAFGVMSTFVSFMFFMEDEDISLQLPPKRRHRYWIAPYLRERCNPYQRNTLSKLETHFLALGSVDEFRATLRMPPDIYKELVDLVTSVIRRQNTNFRQCISVEERLSMTIRYLALGDSIRTLHQAYLVSYSTVQPLVWDTCRAIFSVLHGDYLKTPSTSAEWEHVAAGFRKRWDFPHTIGAVDGKHIRIRCPRNTGSLYYNYKHYFSVVLLAVVDYDYKFIFADVGSEGRASDSRIWRSSKFCQDIESEDNMLNLPAPSHVSGLRGKLPYFFVGDEAFPLGTHMMKPYPSARLTNEQRIFNYRLSRCRRIVENAFGILACRFRLFLRQQDMEPEGVKVLVMAAVVLHNFLRVKSGSTYMPKGSVDIEDREHNMIEGDWRTQGQMDPVIGHQYVRNRSLYVKELRNSLAKWCVSKTGEVAWQYNIVPLTDN